MRRLLAVLSPLLALFLPGALFAQDPTAACPAPAKDTGFQEIAVNVNAGTFSQVLPFDVPLRLCGTTAAETKVEVIYAVGCEPPTLDARGCRSLAEKGGLPVGPVELTREQCRSNAVAYGQGGSATLDGTTFRTVLPRLEAERFYALCFLMEKKVTPAQAAAFAQKARPRLDQALGKETSADISADRSQALRRELAEELLSLVDTGGGQMLASGSLFDPALSQDQVRGNFNSNLKGVLEPQLRRQAQIANFASQQFQLRQALDQVRSNAALGRFVAALERSAVGNVNLATLLSSEYRDELALARMPDDVAAQMALGQTTPGQAEPASGANLDQTLNPAEAGQVASRYQQTSQSLSNPDPKTLGLDELIQDALGSGMLAPYVQELSEADRQELQALAAGPVRKAAFAAFALAGQAKTVQGSLVDRAQALDQLVATVEIAAASVSVASASTVGNFKTAQANYISADGGLLFAQEIDEVLPYVGTNIYFRPVNKNAPLASLGSFGKTFSRRFALTLGLTTSSVTLKDQQDTFVLRDNLFGSQNLLIGAGLRVSDMIRVGAGALVFKENDPSPLIDNLDVQATYYLSISFDLDVATTFKGGLGSLFN